jgi:hypothetical protein
MIQSVDCPYCIYPFFFRMNLMNKSNKSQIIFLYYIIVINFNNVHMVFDAHRIDNNCIIVSLYH